MKNTSDRKLSRRELFRIGGLGLVATGYASANPAKLLAQTAPQQTSPAVPQNFPPTLPQLPRDSGMTHAVITADNLALVRDRANCTRCGQCLDYCYRYNTVQGHRSSEGRLSCINCGQCSIQCETRSITERSGLAEFLAALTDPNIIVVATTSPAVRVAIGEMFKMPEGTYLEGSMVASLKKLGCDYVLDTTFGADLTIMEESSELLHRLEKKADSKYPMFTSCCPGWVRFAELFTPELVPHISSTKSPILMQGAAIKSYFARKNKLEPKKIFNVAITPCTAKKAEIKRAGSNTLTVQPGFEGLAEVDLVLTVRELGAALDAKKIDFTKLEPASYDSLMGRGSAGGVAFGRSGGVMESALRTAYFLINGENAPLKKDVEIRGTRQTVNWVNPMPFGRIAGVRADTVDLKSREIRVAVVETPSSLRGLLDAIEHENERFDFVEVMSCRGGCLGGGGQPYPPELGKIQKLIYARKDAIQSGIDHSKVRLCHENNDIKLAYDEFFETPLSEKAKNFLHCR